MPHNYSIQIHDSLSTKLRLLEQERTKVSENTDSDTKDTYLAGQRSEILWLRKYFQENTDLKNHKYY